MSNMEKIGKITDVQEQLKHDVTYVETLEDGTIVRDMNRQLPTMKFFGTVKLHGTFAGIRYNKKEITALSKGNELSIEKDNAGFAQFVKNREDKLKFYFDELFKTTLEGVTEFQIMGEFAGQGIQKNVGINGLPKSFFMFGIRFKVEDTWEWAYFPKRILKKLSDIDGFYTLFDYANYEIQIDMNDLTPAKNKIDKLIQEIDKQCPVAKAFGLEGHGEGIVWVSYHNGKRYTFKSKGESHSIRPPKKEKIEDPDLLAKMEFAYKVTPTWRLDQAIQEVADTNNNGILTSKHIGPVIKWVIADIIAEEQLLFKESGFIMKDVQKHISKIVSDYTRKAIG